MQVSTELKQRVTQKLESCIALAEKRYAIKVGMPTVLYTLTGKTAGWANYRQWTINLNAILFLHNVEDFLERTVPHEMAHLVCDRVYPEAHRPGYGKKREVHGPRWREVATALGMTDITRCHSYDTSVSARSKAGSTRWKCTCCGSVFTVGAQRTAKLRANAKAYTHCKGSLLTEVAAAPQRTVVAPTVVAPTVVTPAAAPVNTGRTKMEHCTGIYLSNRALQRAELIKLFVSQAGCTPAGAATYYATLKSKYGV